MKTCEENISIKDFLLIQQFGCKISATEENSNVKEKKESMCGFHGNMLDNDKSWKMSDRFLRMIGIKNCSYLKEICTEKSSQSAEELWLITQRAL